MVDGDGMQILVDFYATWCGPCVLMSKELSKLSEKMGDEVGVFKVNTDKYPTISSRYEVYALPTCILFKAGKPVERTPPPNAP
ncbi:thioredoxin-like protein, partial [Baffinella frigidus]